MTRKVVIGVLYPNNSDKNNAQKFLIPTNINVKATVWPTDLLPVMLG
jgi:hypothetical protein